jgi:hypothetical protein
MESPQAVLPPSEPKPASPVAFDNNPSGQSHVILMLLRRGSSIHRSHPDPLLFQLGELHPPSPIVARASENARRQLRLNSPTPPLCRAEANLIDVSWMVGVSIRRCQSSHLRKLLRPMKGERRPCCLGAGRQDHRAKLKWRNCVMVVLKHTVYVVPRAT